MNLTKLTYVTMSDASLLYMKIINLLLYTVLKLFVCTSMYAFYFWKKKETEKIF